MDEDKQNYCIIKVGDLWSGCDLYEGREEVTKGVYGGRCKYYYDSDISLHSFCHYYTFLTDKDFEL
jgi:hypothetical protein